MSKPFAWSWSKLKNFRSCPKRHYELDILKQIKEPESEQLKWGHEVHHAMAERIGRGKPMPSTMQHYGKFADRIIKSRDDGLTVLVENKLAMNKEFQATSFFDNATWFRGVADVLILAPWKATAVTVDWKTGGKVDPEFEQLGLSAQLIFAKYPEIDRVETFYEWLGHERQTPGSYTRDNMMPLWNKLWPEIRVMEDAHKNLTYPPKPSGLCKRYCPVVSCPYHGKGNH
jgi:hypothetical protein